MKVIDLSFPSHFAEDSNISHGSKIIRFGASHGSVFRSAIQYHRIEAVWGRSTKPGLAPKRLMDSSNVDMKDIDVTTFDLSVKNPNGGEEVVHRTPQEIMDEIAVLDGESAEVLATIRGLL